MLTHPNNKNLYHIRSSHTDTLMEAVERSPLDLLNQNMVIGMANRRDLCGLIIRACQMKDAVC